MKINPFKDSNLNDLQKNILQYISDHFGNILDRVSAGWKWFIEKGKEKVTVMFIPHNEKKIINFHISIFSIAVLVTVLSITVTITSVLIVNHASTIKEVSKLEKYGINSNIQIKKYRQEINKLHTLFQKFKPEIKHLYSLTPGNDAETLFARGGVSNPNPGKDIEEAAMTPPDELLKYREIKQELITTKETIKKIKKFIEYRKKIISSTPSVWPVDGYIVNRFQENKFWGINIEAYPASEIRATAPGTVDSVEWHQKLGLTISIKHKYGFVTSYSHCQRVSAEPGQKVSKGEVIGYVGRTGKTTKYACYYQIKIGTEYVDPMPYLNRIGQ